MLVDSRFSRQTINENQSIDIFINGEPFSAQPKDTVASAIMLSGIDANRTTPVSGDKRAPYCMMGVCFECLVQINGKENVQACMTRVEPNMQIWTQNGMRNPALLDQEA